MDMSSVKELARRRVFIFFYAIVGFALIPTIIDEIDQPTHAIDDISLVIIGIVLFIFLAANWKKQSYEDLKWANRIASFAAIAVILFVLLAIAIERNDITDLADDIGKVFFAVALLVNSFV